ncbi:MAG: diguanylate cyclase [Candidatus Hydrogenedentes bacterium]|nr:diguanylate cyclase [Candidatus Hydrogenedentota bacterium]
MEEPQTYTVLVVEDDKHTAELLSYNLTEAGFHVFQAHDGVDALKKLDIVTVDLIICDIMMPQMDGFTLRQRLLKNPAQQHTPFIFLTAKSQPEDQIRGLESGVDEYITKPFDPHVFVARVHAVLRRHENMAQLVRRDPLTQLLNRNTLEREIERELARIKRYSGIGSLVFLDLDDFKEINDRLGHATGDRALVRLASVLTSEIRSVDIVGRYGGEEFVLYFPESTIETSRGIVERMHAAFVELSQEEDNELLTFSAGIAEAPRHGSDFKTLCSRADEAMYSAKHQGKARIIAWTDTKSESSKPA